MLPIDKMILARITGIRSGKIYLVITQPLQHNTPSPARPAPVWNYSLGRRPCLARGVLCFRNYFRWKIQKVYIFYFFSFSASPPQASETSSLRQARLSIIKFASIGFLIGTSFSPARCENPGQRPGSFSSTGN